MQNSTRLLAVCLVVAAECGCSPLFPRNVKPQDSVFVDSNLSERTLEKSSSSRMTTIKADLGKDVVEKWVELDDPEGDDPAAAREFLRAGVSLVDARCDEYFRQLGLAAQNTSFANKELNLTTSVVAALQGLTSVSSKDIALTATSLGFLSASSAAWGDAFIFSPEVSSVQALVANSQKAAKDKMDGMDAADFSKAVAVGLLQDYEKTCEVHTIRRLVNESIASATPIASFSSGDPAADLLRQATRSALATSLGVDGVTERQMIALYWLAYGDERTDEDNKAIVKILPGKLVEDTKQLSDDTALSKALSKIRGAFRALVAVDATKLDAQAAALKKAVVDDVSTKKTADLGAVPGAEGKAVQPKPVQRTKLFAPSLTIRIKQ